MVNIIMPIYKARDTLDRALLSLQNQTDKYFFVTMVVDGEDDDYQDIIKKYPMNIKVINKEKNEGPGLARQLGLDRSYQFEYVMFLDADDMLQPLAVELLTHHAKTTGSDVVYSNLTVERFQGTPDEWDAQNTTTWCHGKIYRTQFLIDNHIYFDPTLRYNEDLFFNYSIMLFTEKISCLHEPCYIWKLNPNSLTRTNNNVDFWRFKNDSYFYAIDRLFERANELNKWDKLPLGAFIGGLYRSAQTMMAVGADMSKAEELTKKFLDYDALAKLITNPKYAMENLLGMPQANRISGTLFVYFEETFSQWIKRLTGFDMKMKF